MAMGGLFAMRQQAEKFLAANACRANEAHCDVWGNVLINGNDNWAENAFFFINPVACRLANKCESAKLKNALQHFPMKRRYARHWGLA